MDRKTQCSFGKTAIIRQARKKNIFFLKSMPEVSQFDWSIVMTFNCTDIYGFSVDTEGFKIGVVTFVCQLQNASNLLHFGSTLFWLKIGFNALTENVMASS